ncbi:class I SAM-dependent methyltransferase [Nocardiopsis synnemataformans]|uniref:class I SAM-dependent methyltransferase n=1 Tax=Nocardiopsis synnemataformans TaxID=61305 RepID=UPI003EB81EEF
MDEQHWADYLTHFHGERPAVTERLLGLAEDNPYAWVAEPLHGSFGAVVDLGCGSAPTRTWLPEAYWVGLDSSSGELARAAAGRRGPLVLADAHALPFASDAVSAVCAAMSLQVLVPLDAVLDEVERVLEPDGVMTALVPARLGPTVRGLAAWIRVLAALRTRRLDWPNPQACDGTARLLRARGWTVLSEDRRVLTLRMEEPEHTSLLVRGLYLPRTGEKRLRAAERTLAAWARPGRFVPLPLLRVVARSPKAP